LKEATKVDEDKPGLGQYYCVSCARYFADPASIEGHNQSKKHKKGYLTFIFRKKMNQTNKTTKLLFRLKVLQTTLPWTVKDSIGNVDNGPKRNKNITTTTTAITTDMNEAEDSKQT
jgi:hypothetical protein